MITDREDLLRPRDRRPRLRRLGAPRGRPAAVRRLELPRLRDPGRGRARAAHAARRAARADAREPGAARRARRRAARARRCGAPNDAGGDAGICLIAFARDRGARRRRGRRAARGGRRGDADLLARHRRPARLPVLEAGARRDRRGGACPRPTARARSTCSSRAIHVDVSPLCDEQDLDEIALAFEKVAARGARLTVRVGVVGGGLVAQAMHLPYLSALRDRFTLAALAEPSATVREALGARYGIAGPPRGLPLAARRGRARRGRRLLAGRDARRGRARRARRGPARLRREADVHHARRRRRDRRRARPGGTRRPGRDDEALRPGRTSRCSRSCPTRAADLRYVSVVVNDPEFEPYFEPGEIVRGADVPPDADRRDARRRRRSRSRQAVGSGDPDVVRAFSESFLGSLAPRPQRRPRRCSSAMGEPLPAKVVGGDWWNEGRAVYGALRLANGARCGPAPGSSSSTRSSTARRSRSFFADSVRTLEFPSPWLKQHPTVYRRSRATSGRTNVVEIAQSYDEAFARELRHFHACIADGTPCRTPPEQARLDIDVLTQMFLALAVTRAAIVGTGFIGRVHAIALRAIGVEVAAVCGRTLEGAEAFGEGRPYDDLDELLDAEQVDVLHVCTPNDVHAEQALAALERGVHVVCEKPLAVSTRGEPAMVDAAAERAGSCTRPATTSRGYPLVEQMRVDVAAGAVGEVAFVHGRYLCDDVLFPASGWRARPGALRPVVRRRRPRHALARPRRARDGPPRDRGAAPSSARSPAGRSRTTPRCCFASRAARRARSSSRRARPAARTSSCSSSRARRPASPGTRSSRPRCSFRPARRAEAGRRQGPARRTRESARSMSRYPAGHGEGYGEAFRNLFEDVYAAIAGRAAPPVPDLRGRPPRRRDGRGRGRERPRRRLGTGLDVAAGRRSDSARVRFPALHSVVVSTTCYG